MATVNIPSHLRKHAFGLKALSVDGNTVGECITQLVSANPALRPDVMDAAGGLLANTSVWINGKAASPESQWEYPVGDEDVIDILYLYAGG